MKVLGIHSSPIREGNTAHVLEAALEEAARQEGVQTEAIALAGLAIGDCRHCNGCTGKAALEQLCALKDDALPILARIRDCDVLVLATPVYFGRLSGTMACLVDRTRCLLFGKAAHQALKDKVGVALAVGWSRNYGMESTLASLHAAFLMHEMRPATCHAAGALHGAAVVSGQRDDGQERGKDRLGATRDLEGLQSVRRLVDQALRMARAGGPTRGGVS